FRSNLRRMHTTYGLTPEVRKFAGMSNERKSRFSRTLVTAALPYANGPIHIGHLAGCYLPADLWVRYKRLKEEKILFISGSDEHGVPITISAEREKVSPQAIVDEYHGLNKKTFERLGMSFDFYARTSSPVHRET